MSQANQPQPVVLFQPPSNPSERQFMDFRPMPIPEKEETDADPKALSAPESAPSSPSVPEQVSPPVSPVPSVPAVKASTQPKVDGNSTQTS